MLDPFKSYILQKWNDGCHYTKGLYLKQAINSNLSPFKRFATRLRFDYDAVKAGVTLPTNNGPVEGHINRLKMLKRQMYGRAKLDLLSRRFLCWPVVADL